jgi:hypothetical protein
MFEPLRDALRGFSARLDPDERRQMMHSMREALVHAKLGLADLRAVLATTDVKLTAERAELETVLRRQGLAAQVNDHETVSIAERFARQHQERVAMLETKRLGQQHELAIAEREYDAMSDELRRIVSGIAAAPHGAVSEAVEQAADGAHRAFDDAPMDAPADPDTVLPRRTRAEKEADADARLAALKRRMGK